MIRRKAPGPYGKQINAKEMDCFIIVVAGL